MNYEYVRGSVVIVGLRSPVLLYRYTGNFHHYNLIYVSMQLVKSLLLTLMTVQVRIDTFNTGGSFKNFREKDIHRLYLAIWTSAPAGLSPKLSQQ
jgi:hypothetical protein